MHPSTPIAPASPNGHDFADWLSPILVKELRQGLKAKVFVSVFTTVQIVMIFIMGIQLLSMATGGSRSTVSELDGFFWFSVWLPLLLLMPGRGLSAISEEVKANTLDLVQLTRMGAFRIVLGKWFALAAQSLLLVTAILPYAVLRYFFGNVNIVEDMAILAWLLTGSLVLTAGALALSSVPLVARIFVMAVLIPGLFIGLSVFSLSRAFGGGGSSLPTDAPWWMLAGAAVVYTLFFLEITASRIAPLSENHAGIKRCGALLLALVPLGLGAVWGTESGVPAAFLLTPLWAWVLFEALTEQTSAEPGIYAGFTKRGLMGRIAARVFTPGWASGIIFTMLLVGMVMAASDLSFMRDAKLGHTVNPLAGHHLEWAMLFFSIISPVLFILALPQIKQRGWVYILAQVFALLLLAIANIAAASPKLSMDEVMPWLGPVPTAALFATLERGPTNELFYSRITLPFSISAVLISALLLWRMFIEFRGMTRVERETGASVDGASIIR